MITAVALEGQLTVVESPSPGPTYPNFEFPTHEPKENDLIRSKSQPQLVLS